MTDQNNAAPLTGDEIRAAIRHAHNMSGPSDATQPAEYVLAGALALLSKLRAPVAEPIGHVTAHYVQEDCGRHPAYTNYGIKWSGEPLEDGAALYAAPVASTLVADERAALQTLVDLEDIRLRLRALHESGHGTDYTHYHHALPGAWEAARAALASAPVAEPYPSRLLHERDNSLAERVDSWHQRNPNCAPVAGEAQHAALVELVECGKLQRDAWENIWSGMSDRVRDGKRMERAYSKRQPKTLEAAIAALYAAPQASAEDVSLDDVKAIAKEVAADSAAIRAEARNAALEEAARVAESTVAGDSKPENPYVTGTAKQAAVRIRAQAQKEQQ